MTDSAKCYTARDSIVVTSFTSLIDANAGSDTSICSKDLRVFLSGKVVAASGGRWRFRDSTALNPGGTFFPSATSLAATYIPSNYEKDSLGNSNLQLITTGNGSCQADTDVVVINITKVPIVKAIKNSGGTDTMCINQFPDSTYSRRFWTDSTTTTDSVVWTVSPATSAYFKVAPNQVNVLTTEVLFTPKTIGLFTITARVFKKSGILCDTVLTKQIRVLPAPSGTITGIDSACVNTTELYYTAKASKRFYYWLAEKGSIIGTPFDTVVQISWDSTGIGKVYLYLGDSITGCDTIITKAVKINARPNITTTGQLNVCSNKRYNYAVASLSGATYSWVGIGGSIITGSADSVISILWGAPPSGLLFIDVTSSEGCQSSAALNITINQTPPPVFTGPTTVCERKTYQYKSPVVSGTSYTWQITGGTIVSSSSDTMVNIKWNTAGTGSIKLTASNTNGCDSVKTYPVTINPTPIPIITGATSGCAGKYFSYKVNSAAFNTYLWSVAGGSIVGSSTDSTVLIKWGVAGSGTVTVKRTNQLGCDSTVNLAITIRETPAPVITGPDRNCVLKRVIYKVNSTALNTYEWSIVGGSILTSIIDSSVMVIWSDTTQGIITVKKTNQFGCDSIISKTVILDSYTLPQILGPDSACERKRFTYSLTNHPGSTYEWSVTNGKIIGSSTATSVVIEWDSITTGTGSVKLKETNTAGCDTSLIRNIRINPTPVPAISGIFSVCENKRYNYSFNRTASSTYQWVINGGTLESPDTAGDITVRWGSQGTGSVSLKQTNQFGCDSTITKTITIKKTPVPQINGDTVVCSDKYEVYTTTSTPGSNYLWSVVGGNIIGSANQISLSVRWINPGIGRVQLKETNSSGCDSLRFLTVRIDSTPVPAISGNVNVCENKFAIYTAQNRPGHTYQWIVSGGVITDSSLKYVISVKWGIQGSGSITLIQRNATGCDSTSSITITINPTPRPSINGNPTVCENKKEGYSVAIPLAGNSYKWKVEGGTIQGLFSTQNLIVLWGSSGTGKVILTQTNGLGCDSVSEFLVTIRATPVPQIVNATPAVCEYTTQSYSALVQPGASYLWSVNGGSIIGSNTSSTVTVRWNQQGLGRVTLQEFNSVGCDSTVFVNLIKRPKPKPKIDGSKRSCAYSQGNIYQIDVIGNPNYSYNWSITPAGTVVGGVGTNSINILFDAPGSYVISVQVIDNVTGCDSAVSMNVFVDTVQQAVITGNVLKGCRPLTVNFVNGSTANNTYQWQFGDGRSVNTPNPSHTYSKAGNYIARLISVNASGCKDTAYDTIVVYDLPKPSFSHNFEGDTIYAVEDTILFTNNSQAADSFNWDMGDLIDAFANLFQPPPKVYALPGVYPVKLVAYDTTTRCSDSLIRYLDIRVYENLFIASAFSPNDDGFNDYFSINFENVTRFRIIIYSRWGQIIYESNNPNFIWDGKLNGKPLPQDVYVYYIEAKGYHGTRFSLKGDITILP
jgi:gliding motility-associated-like protein